MKPDYSSQVFKNIERATILTADHPVFGAGQAVIVGDLILTAAHCVNLGEDPSRWIDPAGWEGDGRRLQKLYRSGSEFSANVKSFEPILDLAVLESPGAVDALELAEPYSLAIAGIDSIPIWDLEPDPGEIVKIHVFTHKKEWIPGQFEFCGRNLRIGFKTQLAIEGGTSGGPVVDDAGRLLSIVSTTIDGTATDGEGEIYHASPLLCVALPAGIKTWLES